MYTPFIFKLTSEFPSDIDFESNVILSSSINLPLITLGFQYFLHRTKAAMSITKNLETKNDFYYVINPFEYKISNYEDSLDKLTNYYFNINSDKMEIKSQDFYKLWEILFFFDICDMNELVYASINETSGAFIQAIINYRQKINNGLKNDKIYNGNINLQNKFELSKEFLGLYNKTYPNLINLYKNKDKINDNRFVHNDSIKGIQKMIESNNSYANLITANGSLNLDIDDNYEEQKSYQLILGQIITALKIQAPKGNFVLKIYETFTLPTLKIIYLLGTFYEEMYIYKPYFSRLSNSEKYLICKHFKYDQKKDNKFLEQKIKVLEKCLTEMNSLKFVYDIFPSLLLPNEYLDNIKFINIKFANLQQIMINEIIKYIKENNYFGDKYHEYREKQIEATKWWTNTFFPPSNNLYTKNKEDLHKILKATLDKYNAELNKFSNSLIK
jgi:23S rRNA U2552 (ribose-2'-O)-methylase RlmE/FtsJ